VSLDKFYGFDFTADKCFAWQQKLIIGKNENKIRYLSLRNKRFTSMLKNGLGSFQIACLKYYSGKLQLRTLTTKKLFCNIKCNKVAQ